MSAKESKTAVTAKEVAKTEEATVTPEKKATVCYIGPGIPNVVQNATIFNNGLTDAIEEEKKKLPALGSLFVEMKKLSSARASLRNKDSALSICYRKVAEYVNQKGE